LTTKITPKLSSTAASTNTLFRFRRPGRKGHRRAFDPVHLD
jgi:hypothetical protein